LFISFTTPTRAFLKTTLNIFITFKILNIIVMVRICVNKSKTAEISPITPVCRAR